MLESRATGCRVDHITLSPGRALRPSVRTRGVLLNSGLKIARRRRCLRLCSSHWKGSNVRICACEHNGSIGIPIEIYRRAACPISWTSQRNYIGRIIYSRDLDRGGSPNPYPIWIYTRPSRLECVGIDHGQRRAIRARARSLGEGYTGANRRRACLQGAILRIVGEKRVLIMESCIGQFTRVWQVPSSAVAADELEVPIAEPSQPGNNAASDAEQSGASCVVADVIEGAAIWSVLKGGAVTAFTRDAFRRNGVVVK